MRAILAGGLVMVGIVDSLTDGGVNGWVVLGVYFLVVGVGVVWMVRGGGGGTGPAAGSGGGMLHG